MLKTIFLSVLVLCGCSQQTDSQPTPTQNTDASPLDPQKPIKVDPELSKGVLPYIPASAEDVKNGRLAKLLMLHRSACKKQDPEQFFALFNQQTRYLYAGVPKQSMLVDTFRMACSEEFIGKYEKLFANNELHIALDGKTEHGIPRLSLCTTDRLVNSECTAELEISVENDDLKWGWH